MFKGRKLLRLLLASSLSGVAFLQLVSCEFGSSSSEADRESEHQRQATAEAKVLATTRFNDATRNFEALEGRLSVAKSQFNEDNQKHKELEDKLAGLVAERDENERLITKLEASLTENKVSYPAV